MCSDPSCLLRDPGEAAGERGDSDQWLLHHWELQGLHHAASVRNQTHRAQEDGGHVAGGEIWTRVMDWSISTEWREREILMKRQIAKVFMASFLKTGSFWLERVMILLSDLFNSLDRRLCRLFNMPDCGLQVCRIGKNSIQLQGNSWASAPLCPG